jgi:hypothetical protein
VKKRRIVTELLEPDGNSHSGNQGKHREARGGLDSRDTTHSRTAEGQIDETAKMLFPAHVSVQAQFVWMNTAGFLLHVENRRYPSQPTKDDLQPHPLQAFADMPCGTNKQDLPCPPYCPMSTL